MTELFIEKAKKIHGNIYDYSKTEYKKNNEKVIIMCKTHDEFQQRPSGHLSGKGCIKCGFNSTGKKLKKPNKIFINQAINIHGNTYDYSQCDYIDAKTNIKIICKEHGLFEQLPNCHLVGSGCNKCSLILSSLKRTKHVETFIKEAKKIHGDKYDYSKVDYVNGHSKVVIICKTHGEFEQIPNSHLRGTNCFRCTGTPLKTTLQFIEDVKKIHGNKYDYSLVDYKGDMIPIKIICKFHGVFETRPHNHNAGHNCFRCTGTPLKTTFQFIEDAKKIHGDKYDYSNTKYDKANKPITIVCKKHGEFIQTANAHLCGSGCRLCCSNYSIVQIKWLNFIQLNNNITIQHAENYGEFIIPTLKYKADGYCRETNTIYEFNGDFWHGNPKIYNKNNINARNGKTFGELYQTTLEREQQIRDLGYNLVIMWEHDWKKINKSIRVLQRKFKSSRV